MTNSFNGCFEVVSVSKTDHTVTFNNVVWLKFKETLNQVKVGYIGFEIVKKFISECVHNITVKTDKDFKVGQKISSDDFNKNLDTKVFMVRRSGIRKTGVISDVVIENRMLSCDSDGLWDSDKISTDDIKSLIGILNEMAKTNS